MSDNDNDTPKKEIPKGLKIALFLIFIIVGVGIMLLTSHNYSHISLQKGEQGQPAQQAPAPQQ